MRLPLRAAAIATARCPGDTPASSDADEGPGEREREDEDPGDGERERVRVGEPARAAAIARARWAGDGSSSGLPAPGERERERAVASGEPARDEPPERVRGGELLACCASATRREASRLAFVLSHVSLRVTLPRFAAWIFTAAACCPRS